jgi:hypothetical protein
MNHDYSAVPESSRLGSSFRAIFFAKKEARALASLLLH